LSTRKAKLKLVLVGAALLFCALGLWAFWLEPASLTIRRQTIRIPNWHPEHQDLRVAVLTDLHVGSPHAGLDKLKAVVTRTNEEGPDLVIILGDLVIQEVVGGRFIEPELIAGVLGGLRAPMGVFAVLGNHDWWLDGHRVTAALQRAGIRVLENDAAVVQRGGRTFWVVGIADLWTRKPDIAGSLGQTDGTNPVILITHNPDIFPDVPAVVSLTLAGHTHGGQVNLPFVGRPIVPSDFGQRYAMGHIVEDGRHLFVSGGVGTSILPVRFRVPPEVVILTLAVGPR
jgi:predicted MPP superfamily phosphohydrolase